MYAKITKDLLYDGKIIEIDRTGIVLLNGTPIGDTLEVRLLDDDREVCYLALADDEGLETLYSWAMSDAGTTILQTKGRDGWEDALS